MSIYLLVMVVGCGRPSGDLAAVLEADTRNAGIRASASCDEVFACNNLIFSIDEVSGSRADVSRVLFQFAESQAERRYESVFLSSKGVKKLMLPGDYFQQLGRDYKGGENPLYLMNHLPENTRNLDGTAAFQSWSGGWMGVASKQMDDLTALHDRWWATP
ncbi:hypothetical protein LBMAG42_56900 [Deltaproteobacteria bacterium]|nr:hypothetical protein LBMAG42_56900 [Deltaproteobacteria bacterium]